MRKFSAIVKGDRIIWIIFIFLSIVSLLAVYTSIGRTATYNMHRSPLVPTMRHLAFIVGGYILVWLGSNTNYRFYARVSKAAFVGSILFLLVVLIVFKDRWIQIPIIGSFQPSEIAKICLIIFLATILSQYNEKMGNKYFVPIVLIPILLTAGLILPKNLSSAIIVFVVSVVMMFVAGVDKKSLGKYLLILMALAGIFVLIIVQMQSKGDEVFRSSTWYNRVAFWLHPELEEYSQENLSRMAVARGGLFGAGIGNTIHGRLMTQSQNDFIYAVIVEETGSFLGLIILGAYSWLYLRCVVIARRCEKIFGKLICVGMGTLIYFQALVHICVCVGVIPVTGQTLPFISYGGSAYLVMSFGLGAVQSIAHYEKQCKARAERNAQQSAVGRDVTQHTPAVSGQ